MASANTLSATVSQLASGIGVAVSALLLQAAAGSGWLPDGGPVKYQVAFVATAVFTRLPLASALRMERGAAARVAGR